VTVSHRYTYPQPLPHRRSGPRRDRIEQALKAEIEDLRNASPTGRALTTTRFLFYRLVAKKIVPKQSSGARRPDQDVSLVVSQLKWAGAADSSEIVVRSRRVLDFTGYPTIPEGVRDLIESVRLDPWQDAAPVLVVESESLGGLLEDMAYEYRVPLAAARGQASRGFVLDVVRWVEQGHQRVRYLGDFDLSGGHIEDAVRERVDALTGVTLDWRRVALTREQVGDHSLPVVQKTDRRFAPSPDGSPRRFPAVETEALDQRILLPLVRGSLDELLPVSLREVEPREAEERKVILARPGVDA
jgi:hypothetical protein